MKIKSFKILLVIFLSFLMFGEVNGAFAKKIISVEATILEKDISDPTDGDFALSCPQSFEITSLNTLNRLSIPSQNIIIRPQGEIKSFASNIRIDTDCDLIIQEGGKITADGESGGFITFNVGGNMKIGGQVSAKGTSISGSGGFLRLTTGKDLVLDGEIDASGLNDGGFIRGDVGGNLRIKNNSMIANGGFGEGGSIRFAVGKNLQTSGNFTADGETGGFLRIDAQGDADISGTTSTKGKLDGGQIRFFAKGKVSISGNSLIADGDKGVGGIITVDSGKSLVISGFYSANGKNGGSLFANSGNDITITSNGRVNTVGSDGNGGIITIKAKNKLTINGQIKAGGNKSPGRIDLNYCSKDFSGASFDITPTENISCFTQNIQPQNTQTQQPPQTITESQSSANLNQDQINTIQNQSQNEDLMLTPQNNQIQSQLSPSAPINQDFLQMTDVKILTPSIIKIPTFKIMPISNGN